MIRTTYSRGNSRRVRIILINCQLQTSRQNSQQSQGRQQGNWMYYCATSNIQAVKRHRLKKNRSPSVLALSRKRQAWFLEKKLAGKPDLALPEEDQRDSDSSVCVKEQENTSLACGSTDVVNALRVYVLATYLRSLIQEIYSTGLEDGWQVTEDHTPGRAP